MSDATLVLVLLAAGSYLLKSLGPLVLGGERALPAWLERLALLLPLPLLAALVVTSTVADGTDLVADARLVGVAAAALALWRRAPFVVVVIVAALATASARAAGLS
jgi:branched-subunit amino acid transport protein